MTSTGGSTFKGSFNGDRSFFGGLTIGELYLIRAECYARKGNRIEALKDLNTLLKSRFSGNYIEISTSSSEEALARIISERRKELVFRGLRWSDLRRLNRDSRFRVTLTKTLNGVTYTLPPQDTKYVLPIDEIEIRLTGIQQNER